MGLFADINMQSSARLPGSFEEISVEDEAVGLSFPKIIPTSGHFKAMEARSALLSLESADIRFRLDGEDPTSSIGHYLTSGDTLFLGGTQALKQFKAIRTAELNAKLTVTYFF